MTEIPLGQACPDVQVDLAEGEHVTGLVAFLIVEDATSHAQQVQMVATDGLAGITMRGLVELGRDILLASQNDDEAP